MNAAENINKFQNELLTKQVNTVLGLRKITSFEVGEVRGSFSMRPQMHLLIVKPFGTIKSAFIQKFEKVLDKDLIIRDELTKPAILGTISKDGTYVPGWPAATGGKVTVIDEFNNLDPFAQRALLGILENQRISRQLGFAVSKPYNSDLNEWVDLHVSEGAIEGRVNFSCIAFAMNYPKAKHFGSFEEDPQSLLGLKSRFSPNFSCPEHDELFDMLSGESCFEIVDCGSTPVRNITVKKEAYLDYLQWFKEFTRPFTEKGNPNHFLEPSRIGFLTRVSADILRFSAHEVLSDTKSSEKMLCLDDDSLLIEQAKRWSEPLLRQYIYEEGAGGYSDFLRLIAKEPERTKRYYAQKLNKSERQIQRWKKKHNESTLKVEVLR